MKRDWDVIREVLIEVEALSDHDRSRFSYRTDPHKDDEENTKAKHAILLKDAGFVTGAHTKLVDGKHIFLGPNLTWQGHELLDTIRSKPVWEKIKNTAQEKGIELSFDAVIQLGKSVLALIAS